MGHRGRDNLADRGPECLRRGVGRLGDDATLRRKLDGRKVWRPGLGSRLMDRSSVITQIAAILAHGKCHESTPSLGTSGQVERSYEVSEEGIKCPQRVVQPRLRSDLLADKLGGDIHVRIVGTKKMGLRNTQ